MLIGEVVEVSFFNESSRDSFNNAASVPEWELVENVLVVPGQTNDVTDSVRPDGKSVSYTLHFPKGFDRSLRGALVKVRGEEFRVVGDPKHYTLENTPTKWWLPVEVENVAG